MLVKLTKRMIARKNQTRIRHTGDVNDLWSEEYLKYVADLREPVIRLRKAGVCGIAVYDVHLFLFRGIHIPKKQAIFISQQDYHYPLRTNA